MTDDWLRAIARVHGALALAMTAALGWAAWRARRGRPAGPATIAAAALGTIVGAFGIALEPRYRMHARAALFARSAELGWLFERKQHLAFGAIGLAWCAAFAMRASRTSGDASGADLHRAASRALWAATVLAVLATVASAIARS